MKGDVETALEVIKRRSTERTRVTGSSAIIGHGLCAARADRRSGRDLFARFNRALTQRHDDIVRQDADLAPLNAGLQRKFTIGLGQGRVANHSRGAKVAVISVEQRLAVPHRGVLHQDGVADVALQIGRRCAKGGWNACERIKIIIDQSLPGEEVFQFATSKLCSNSMLLVVLAQERPHKLPALAGGAILVRKAADGSMIETYYDNDIDKNVVTFMGASEWYDQLKLEATN